MGDERGLVPWSDSELGATFSAAKSAWPTLALSADEYADFLVCRFPAARSISEGILQDLFLACACGRNVPGALRCFAERFLPIVTRVVRKFDPSPSFVEEVYQRLSETMFVGGASRRPKIESYTGQGPLSGFVGTAARRVALRLVSKAARFQGEEALMERFSQDNEHETALLKHQYRDTFNKALSTALRQLPRRERLILRMNLVEHVSTTRIAAIYKVSQPTVSRWIQRAARSIFATVKDLVCDELEIDTSELESLLLVVRSQIEITIFQAHVASTTSSEAT
jgi:RNA polymerase sigma-70 factor, ECF subfamily